MTLEWARAQYPWVDLQAVEFPHKCHECGSGFDDGDGWIVKDNGKWVEVCDDCIYRYVRRQDNLARRFIDQNRLWNEFLEWWWEGIDGIERLDVLRDVYERREQDKQVMEAQFATEHKYWDDFVIDEMEGERA